MHILEVFDQACRAAGAIALKQQGVSGIVLDKGDASDFATQADMDAGNAIERILKQHLPQYEIVAEENKAGLNVDTFREQRQAILDSGMYIVFDDLDATFVYHHSVRVGGRRYGGTDFGHQIGLVENHVLTHCMLYMPRLFINVTAKRNEGCFINGAQHRLPEGITSKDSLFYLVRHKDVPPSFDEMTRQIIYGLQPGGYVCFNSNISGLTRVALGEVGAFIGTGKIWDFLGLLAIEEAGGFAASADGQPFNWRRIPQVVVAAASRDIGESILAITKQYPSYQQHFWDNPKFQS